MCFNLSWQLVAVPILPVHGKPWKERPLNELCTADLPFKPLLQLHQCWGCSLALIRSERWRLKSCFAARGSLNHHPDIKFHLSYLATEHISTNHLLDMEHVPPLNCSNFYTPLLHNCSLEGWHLWGQQVTTWPSAPNPAAWYRPKAGPTDALHLQNGYCSPRCAKAEPRWGSV